ncbi:MAG: hypothetical protein ACT4QE_22585, partial [Anaerolineales bacterium]
KAKEMAVATKVAQMTRNELESLIGEVVERKLLELLADPDAGLIMTRAMRNLLLRQKKAVAKGARGETLSEVVARLGLD